MHHALHTRCASRATRLLACVLAGLFVAACDAPARDWTDVLRRAAGGTLELDVADADLREVARRATADWDHGGRLLAMRFDDPEAVSWLEGIGASREDDRWWIAGFAFGGERDLLIACFEDPDAAGAPLALYLGGDDEVLAAWLAEARPLSRRPSARLVVDDRTAFTAPLARDGRLRDRRLERVVQPSLRDHDLSRELRADPLLGTKSVVRGPRVGEDRANDYLRRGLQAARRAAEWCGGARGAAHIELHSRGSSYSLAGGRHELGRTDPTGRRVAALLLPDLPDDGGAVFAEALARRTWGPPADAEVGAAFGAAAAGTYWGHPLDEWGAAGTPTAFDRVVRLAALFRVGGSIGEGRDHGALRELWTTGTSSTALVAPSPQPAGPPAAPDGDVEALRGIVLELPPSPLVGREDLERELAQAGARGANGVSVSCATLAVPRLPDRIGERAAPAGRTVQGDALVAALLAEAKGHGLAHRVLRPRVHEFESGDESSRRKRTTVAGWTEAFELHAATVRHAADLAQLVGVRDLVVGEQLWDATRTEETDKTGLPPEVLAEKREGWTRVAEAARSRFGGRVTYLAAWPGEARRLAIWDRFDCLAFSWFPTVDSGEDPPPTDRDLRGPLRAQLDRMDEFAAELDMPFYVLECGVPASERAWVDGRAAPGAPDAAAQGRTYSALAWALEVATERCERYEGVALTGWGRTQPAAGRSDRARDGAAATAVMRILRGGRGRR